MYSFRDALVFEDIECLQYLAMCIEEGLPFPAWADEYIVPEDVAPHKGEGE